ncbi:type I glyceraldehyde-3-phosphate dehydrogenase [Caldisericum exile]|uniref:Glyceraldehyde-3-phosphate dehydrogenase n=1 Tax=Caldisericum exile (strain DSM 21853 / NBRC 104410 / AZM16c01) TaxID=511051 RepID=A0A7U6GE86_CALEA|nr:type I glyceraldehyde-3-phosphate dehydrogenase [Caldisericum exile]BAL80774.1 glyceraldehyde-3-phosphate dehydrogenase [Caldisericum exile AZM16c01]
MAKVAINGFGRVGRQVFKRLTEVYPEIEVVAINDLFPPDQLAFLAKYDSNYGIWQRDIKLEGNELVVDGRRTKMFAEKDPTNLPWKDLGVDIVIESSGAFTKRDKAMLHIQAGAKKVIITAPAEGEDITVVLGVNENLLDMEKHVIISNASCTTNSIAPVIKVIHDKIGIEKGFLTTTHSYTQDQRLLDSPHKDPRRARSAATNIIPTTTGAAKAVALTIPELKGKLHGFALRVPTPTVSISVFNAVLKRNATAEEVNGYLKEASETYMKGILGYTEEPLVSSDFKGITYSGVVDALSTMVVDGNLLNVVSWYDNEWGYSCRVADLTKLVVEKAGY